MASLEFENAPTTRMEGLQTMSKSVLAWMILALMAAGAAAQTVTGSGNANTVPVFTSTPATGNSTVTSSPITVSGSNVGTGASIPRLDENRFRISNNGKDSK